MQERDKIRLPWNRQLLRPGMRVAAAVSGGADSVALLRVLAEEACDLGIVLQAVHVNHGLRGAESDGDEAFVRELASELGLELHVKHVDTQAERHGNGVEETARRLRYAWWAELLAVGMVDAVATAHTLEDQAETVLGKLLRGAWTEGLAGVFPVVEYPRGCIVRPFLPVQRKAIEQWLQSRGASWREDSSNRERTFTRNRIRLELLPELERWNPQIRTNLSQMAELARDEERYWDSELDRLEPLLLLSGKPVRGGGRASGETVALDVVRLQALPTALQRRLLRRAAERVGATVDFPATEAMRLLVTHGRAGELRPLGAGWMAERTPRELRLSLGAPVPKPQAVVEFSLPGSVEVQGWRLEVDAEVTGNAVVRPWRAGDRVRLRHSSGPKKVKEVLERMRISGTDRAGWLVMEWSGEIVWMQGTDVAGPFSVRATQIPVLANDPQNLG